MGKLEHGKYGGNIIELPFWKHFSIFFGGCYIWLVVSTPMKYKVSWDYSSQYMENNMFQTTNQI